MTQAVRVTVQRRFARVAPAIPVSRVPTPAEYVRQARRLRARHGSDLGRLHAELATLSPVPARITEPKQELPALPWGGENAGVFAEQVRLAMDGPVLRYSARLQLLAEASRLRIRRFDANLIIAWVVQENSTRMGEITPSPVDRITQTSPVLATLVTFLILQSAIIAGVLWLWTTR